MKKLRRAQLERFLADIEQRRSAYEHSVARTRSLLYDIFRNAGLDVATISGRVKSTKSIREKLTRKQYTDPQTEMTDICGLRIITYLERDVDFVVTVLCREFLVDDSNSVDKREELRPNELGYRSVHLLCSFSSPRAALPEYTGFETLRFEVQVRTVLQHAWAQIEWGRRYKFRGVLPDHLQRRLLLASGALEILDREFSSIAADIDTYSKTLNAEPDEPINTLVIRSVAEEIFTSTRLEWELYASTSPMFQSQDPQSELIEELLAFKILTRSELRNIASQDFLSTLEKTETEPTNEMGLFRDAMMWNDLERYFSDAHKGHWHGTNVSSVALLLHKYSEEEVTQAFTQGRIDISDYACDDTDDLYRSVKAIATRFGITQNHRNSHHKTEAGSTLEK